MTGEIELRTEGPVAIVTLNRPAKLNAVHLQLMVELAELLESLEAREDVGAIVLTGAGRAFCAGGDVKTMIDNAAHSFEHNVADLRRMHRVPAVIRSMMKIVVAAVNGPAAGAGMTLAAACDFRIAATSARFTSAFAKVGLSGDMGGSYTLPKIIGAALTRDLYLTGRTVESEEALRIGLVNRVVSDEDCLGGAIAFARDIASGPRLAYGYMKRNLFMAETLDFNSLLDIEALHQERCVATRDHAEARQAFIERRPATFQGR